MSFDVLTMGRIGVDIYPHQIGVPLAEVETFGKFLGGSPTNVACATARYGHSSAVVSKVGADAFGTFVRKALHDLHVDDRYVGTEESVPTPVTFCEIFPPDDFPLYFYRNPIAPDLLLAADELDLAAIREATIFWATVTGLSVQPSREAHLAAWRARARSGITILDLDWRSMFWDDPSQARPLIQEALSYCTIAIGNREECEVAVGESEPDRAADALLDLGLEIAVVKQGPKGVLAKTRQDRVEVPPMPVDVVNGLGAGDAFGGAFCHGLLSGLGIERTLAFANVAGAIVASRLECSTAMPTEAEVLGHLDGTAEQDGRPEHPAKPGQEPSKGRVR
ncbi:MAG: 5-dehydro-2-deoxygluconokinase [Actinomycetales bacterium]